MCTGCRVLGCLWSVSLVAWWLRKQGCRQYRSPWFKPTWSTKECSVPRPAVKSAHIAERFFRPGGWWWDLHGETICRWCRSSTSPWTAPHALVASTSTTSSLHLFHFLIYKLIFSQKRFWYPCPQWEVNEWWNKSYYLFQASLHFSRYWNDKKKNLVSRVRRWASVSQFPI